LAPALPVPAPPPSLSFFGVEEGVFAGLELGVPEPGVPPPLFRTILLRGVRLLFESVRSALSGVPAGSERARASSSPPLGLDASSRAGLDAFLPLLPEPSTEPEPLPTFAASPSPSVTLFFGLAALG
jgi:hypothetical protein